MTAHAWTSSTARCQESGFDVDVAVVLEGYPGETWSGDADCPMCDTVHAFQGVQQLKKCDDATDLRIRFPPNPFETPRPMTQTRDLHMIVPRTRADALRDFQQAQALSAEIEEESPGPERLPDALRDKADGALRLLDDAFDIECRHHERRQMAFIQASRAQLLARLGRTEEAADAADDAWDHARRVLTGEQRERIRQIAIEIGR